MDESHRYRATAGVRAINELRPILGLELTATPQVEAGGKSVPFKNVIYSYPLASAMTDGFVKEPAVATRENFDATAYTSEGLEMVKLQDGVRIHENTKVELEVYARNNDKPIVKPFMLVVATDTTHANALQQVIEGEAFFDCRYKGKVIQVHSKTGSEEKDALRLRRTASGLDSVCQPDTRFVRIWCKCPCKCPCKRWCKRRCKRTLGLSRAGSQCRSHLSESWFRASSRITIRRSPI
jgi:hypothetical protein